MKARLTGLAIAVSAAALPMTAQAQLKPETPTGSLIPVKPETVDPQQAGRIRKGFARCVYGTARSKATALLNNSDPETVDLAAAKIKDVKRDLAMESCLGGEVGISQSALGMKIGDSLLRDLLAEEAYLGANKKAPVLPAAPAVPPLLQARYVSTGDALTRAQGMVAFTDCVVLKNVAQADALLRTMPGSKEELAAAKALAPSLGGCLVAGQKATLTATGIRAFMAYAMWNRFGRGAAQ